MTSACRLGEQLVIYSLQKRCDSACFVSLTIETEVDLMGMFLIAGSFRVTGAQPDGDSIRFTPNDPARWDRSPVRTGSNATPVAPPNCGWTPSMRWKPITGAPAP